MSVFVVDENGVRIEPVAECDVSVDSLLSFFPNETDSQFHCLNRIDPYGDTIFNYLQVWDVRRELAMLKPTTDRERIIIAEIDALIDVCLSRPHLYLKFFGD
jgi:hypothetical protein